MPFPREITLKTLKKKKQNIRLNRNFPYFTGTKGKLQSSGLKPLRRIKQGKQPTKYFLTLEKQNYNGKLIREVRRAEGEILHEENDILLYIESFCTDLFTSSRGELKVQATHWNLK